MQRIHRHSHATCDRKRILIANIITHYRSFLLVQPASPTLSFPAEDKLSALVLFFRLFLFDSFLVHFLQVRIAIQPVVVHFG